MTLLRKVCPVCALVALSWLTMLSFKWMGYDVNDELMAMLMGGSIVGVSYVLGTRMLLAPATAVYWKLIAIPIGFALMYALLSFVWGYVLLAAAAYAAAWVFFRSVSAAPAGNREFKDISKALDNCCD